jgi:hypothetical protein
VKISLLRSHLEIGTRAWNTWKAHVRPKKVSYMHTLLATMNVLDENNINNKNNINNIKNNSNNNNH